ncbi:MAG: protein serine/threonine phosphatase [Bacteroidetes bacterium]|jgi:serine phosphatase RsbU (regulator of sigma subunit)|nr:protein serine/threonine phosphatase [Bacteroidota bacterium]
MNNQKVFQLLGLLLVLFPATLFSQTPTSDSLQQILKSAKTDTAKCRILSALVDSEYDDKIWPQYNRQIEEICESNLKRTDLDSVSERIFKTSLGASYTNSGYIKKQHGDIHTALDFYFKGLKILEEMGDKKGQAEAYNNIGFIYKSQNEYQKALDYFKKCQALFEGLKDKKGITTSLNNMGYIYHALANVKQDNNKKQELLDKALFYYEQSLTNNQELKNERGIAMSQYNVGYVYLDKGDTTKALDYFAKSLEIRRGLNEKLGIAQTVNVVGEILFSRGETSEALKKAEEGFRIAKENGFAKALESSSKTLGKIYAGTGNWRGAYEMQLLYKQMSDSISNEKNQKELFQKGYQYEYEKKAAADSVKAEEEKKVVAIQLKQEKTQRFALYGGLALVLVFAGFIFNRFKTTQKQNRIIQLQKEKVEKQKEEIEHQKELVDDKQKEIVDSITYAKRLQQAILPPAAYLDRYLGSNFVLYRPKDIVAGDFYWMFESEGLVLIAAADSTGHGVPGAMVSIVCSNALDKAVKEFKLREPGEILDKVTDLVLDTFAKSGEEIKDGMDISLLSIDKKNQSIKWSGANNQLWYVKPGIAGGVFTEIKANKQPIGKSDHRVPFTTHTIDWIPGTLFYLLTDGYPDQFGGPDLTSRQAGGKKFKYKQLEELLQEIHYLPLQEQSRILDQRFESWKGSLEQVDDVTIIGVRI